MGKQLSELDEKLRQFIEDQKIFFVGTAGLDGRVNVSPKGMDTLKIIDSQKLAWLNLTGSGNETAAHVLECNRITLMFCAFEGKPSILRIYGKASIIHPRDKGWGETIGQFTSIAGSRQIFLVDIEMVATSCGFGVPLYEFVEERNQLVQWADKVGTDGVEKYWRENNQKSIDGKPTGVLG